MLQGRAEPGRLNSLLVALKRRLDPSLGYHSIPRIGQDQQVVKHNSSSSALSPGDYYYDHLQVGASFRTGRITITEAHVVNFAGISGDFFDVHMDDTFARELGFPARIAHGLLGLCLIDGLKNRASVQLQAVASLGWKEWSFTQPIFIGDSIGATITVADLRLTSKGDRGIAELAFDVKNQRDEQVQTGRNLLLMRRQR